MFSSIDDSRGAQAMPECPSDSSKATEVPCLLKVGGERTFTIIYTNGLADGPHQLPSYQGLCGKAELVLLTPVAILADATIIGAIYCYFALPGLHVN